jgi:hypothetical protein
MNPRQTGGEAAETNAQRSIARRAFRGNQKSERRYCLDHRPDFILFRRDLLITHRRKSYAESHIMCDRPHDVRNENRQWKTGD